MSRVALENLVKRFDGPEGEIVAVDDVSLTIEDGEFLVIVGPSGSGKSTTLRSIAGLETPSEGTVRVGDDDVTNLPPYQRDIAMVFQNYALYPHKTVEGNMSYGLEKSDDLSKDEIAERVAEFAEMMGIGDILEKHPDQLSGGQKQRVALGRAIVQDPQVFLMDEPLSNLDAKLKLQMRTEFQRIHQELGNTTVYVTHDQEEAMTMGDRIVVMHQGEIQQVDTPAEIYDRPRNQFVARFIGELTMNFVDVRVAEGTLHGEGFSVDTAGEGVDVPDGEYVLGIRPEDIVLDEGRNPAGTAHVTVTEPTGSEAVVYLEGATDWSVKTSRDRVPAVDAEVSFDVPIEKIHLFDPGTGETVYHGRAKRENPTKQPA
jgi:multiple sugar transport system ATP-binding protein